MMNFFKSLFGKQTDNVSIEPPTSTADQLCYVIENITLSAQSKLIVGAGQVALLYANHNRSNLYPTGEHLLSEREKIFIQQNPQANVLFIQTAPPVTRQWNFLLPTAEQESVRLQGTCLVAVENAKALCDGLMQAKIEIATSTIDYWINTILKEIIQTQHITIDDIENYRQRFEQFLIDAINPILFDKGLSLRNLTINDINPYSLVTDQSEDKQPVEQQSQQKDKANTTHEINSDANKIANDEDNLAQQKSNDFFNTSATIDTGPKLYYRVINGHQDGPYSVYQLQQLIEQHTLKPSDLIWKKGFSSWQRADTIEQLVWSDV